MPYTFVSARRELAAKAEPVEAKVSINLLYTKSSARQALDIYERMFERSMQGRVNTNQSVLRRTDPVQNSYLIYFAQHICSMLELLPLKVYACPIILHETNL